MSVYDFKLSVLGEQNWDPFDDNIDVEVEFDNGSRYTATFFTLKNLESLFEKNRVTGECGNGLYVWAVEMIVVRDLRLETLRSTVESLLNEDEFHSAFGNAASE